MTDVRDTSIKTYHEIIDEQLIGEMQAKVLKAFKMMPYSTDREVSEAYAIKINCVTGRRNELVNMGCLKESAKRDCKISGRQAYTWYIPEEVPFVQLNKSAKIICSQCMGKGYI